ncbi:MAG: hypothetical protein CM15mP49_12910 [Actinomycetota bacterium]|nr:MAG: hypothetical protein CM15mP49_12910 [Actinomycetota bacterium]
MNLFNIGVEGQYRLAALFAAYIGALVTLPLFSHSANADSGYGSWRSIFGHCWRFESNQRR